jgi:hypothetical protein
MKTLFAFTVAWTIATTALIAAEWRSLFNGRDLTGWRVRSGAAPFAVEDEAIVGTTVPDSPNSFLATEEVFGDFILELEMRQEAEATFNSGIQFRSQSRPDYQNGRVHGYQCEFDPSPRAWTGGIYDEARRKWLYAPDLNPAARSALKPGEWNRLRIEAIGSSLRTWVNGIPVAHLIDDVDASGFIALQVHGIGRDADLAGRKVRWRGIRIQTGPGLAPSPATPGLFVRNCLVNQVHPAEAAEGWRLLWDGHSTAGWRGARLATFPDKGWEIKEGVLSVLATGGGESTAGGDIVTEKRHACFDLQLEFRVTAGANSGIKYYCQPNLDPITGSGAPAGTGSAIGLEFQILDDQRHPDAKLGREGNRTVGSLYDLFAAAKKPAVAPDEWHHARVVSDGRRVAHYLDGHKVVEYERGSPRFREAIAASKYKNIPGFGEWADGHLLLQDHGDHVSFRSIKLRELP